MTRMGSQFAPNVARAAGLATVLLAMVLLVQQARAQDVPPDDEPSPPAAETLSYDEVQALIDRVQKQVESMSAATDARDDAIRFLEEQIDKATSRIEGTEETAEALKARAANLDLQVEGLSEEREQLSSEADERARLVGDLERRIGDLQSLLEGERTDRAETQGSLEQVQAALEAERQAKAALEAELARARASAEEETTTLSAEIDARETALEEARAQVRRMNTQLRRLTDQLATVGGLLSASEDTVRDQQTRITDLGAQLNQALADQVEELSQYRSEFFGRLKQALGDRPEFRIVGDRFVFQSEVLFDSGSARIDPAGLSELRRLAQILRDVTATIPDELDWILRVDGHTDRVPVGASAAFASNWELSTARAISVVQFLIREGIPPQRLAATGFGEFQPLDPRDDEIAYRRNRRIEFKLTSG